MTVRLLHRYQCSFCKTGAAATLRFGWDMPLLPCGACRRYMRYLRSHEISEAEWQSRHRLPPEFISAYPVDVVPPELREQKCGRRGCVVWKPKPELLNGRFCSEACGAADSLEMEALGQRLDALYAEMPWLRPQVKEIA